MLFGVVVAVGVRVSGIHLAKKEKKEAEESPWSYVYSVCVVYFE